MRTKADDSVSRMGMMASNLLYEIDRVEEQIAEAGDAPNTVEYLTGARDHLLAALASVRAAIAALAPEETS